MLNFVKLLQAFHRHRGACAKFCAVLLEIRAAVDFCDMSVKALQNFNRKHVSVNILRKSDLSIVFVYEYVSND